jgi:hypothetical protein
VATTAGFIQNLFRQAIKILLIGWNNDVFNLWRAHPGHRRFHAIRLVERDRLLDVRLTVKLRVEDCGSNPSTLNQRLLIPFDTGRARRKPDDGHAARAHKLEVCLAAHRPVSPCGRPPIGTSRQDVRSSQLDEPVRLIK